MSWDDYYVIVYHILSYLYAALKNGEDIKPEYLKEDSPLFKGSLNKRYWTYITVNLYKQGFIDGLWIDRIDRGIIITRLEDTMITPDGIGYLNDNTFIKKAKKFLKETKESTPFV